MNHQDVFDEFIRMAQSERQDKFLKFNERTSCLQPMVMALRADIARRTMTKMSFDQIRRTLEQKSPNDSQKYQNALNYVATNWPSWNRGVMVMPQIGTQSQLQHRLGVPPKVPPRPPTISGVVPIGWKYESFDPVKQSWTHALTMAEFLPPLDKSETTRINESLLRAKYAVELARDILIKISGWSTPLNPNQQAYVDYFGSYDRQRFKLVLDNFKILVFAFQVGPKIIDLRNTDYGKTCYAACFRANLRGNTNGSLSLTGKVDMFLGRAFLKSRGGSYTSSTDATVGTLVHEFAHGAINAVDAPPVITNTAPWRWQLTPNLVTTHDEYGASPDNGIQASTEADDKALATFNADIAIRNADNYGQFASTMLRREGK